MKSHRQLGPCSWQWVPECTRAQLDGAGLEASLPCGARVWTVLEACALRDVTVTPTGPLEAIVWLRLPMLLLPVSSSWLVCRSLRALRARGCHLGRDIRRR